MKLGEVGADFFTPPDMSMPESPELDKAMGYDIQPGDSAAAQFSKGLQSALLRGSPTGKALIADITKQKIAMQLQLQMQQQQRELAKQNPEYTHFMNAGTGIVMGIDKFGNTKMFTADNPEIQAQREANLAKLQGEAAKDKFEGSPEYQSAKLRQMTSSSDAQDAMAGYHKAQTAAMPELMDARKQSATAAARYKLLQMNNPTVEENQLSNNITRAQAKLDAAPFMPQSQKDQAQKNIDAMKQQLEGLKQQRQQKVNAMSSGLLATPQQQQDALDPSTQLNNILGQDFDQ